MSKKVKTTPDAEVKEEETPKSKLRETLEFLAPIIIALIVAMILKYCVFANAVIPTGSMLNTIQKGDRVIASRLEYKFNEPERFDIAIFKYPDNEKELFVKRIIGLPGETIQIKDGQILIDGETYQENGEFPGIENAGVAETRVTLGNGEYFVLGDNRNNSEDSRYADMGNVKKRNIIGKVWFIASPWSRFGFV